MIRAQIQRSSGVKAKEVPLSVRDLNAVLVVFLKRVRGEGEWMETCAILGGAPESVVVRFCTDVEMRQYQKQYRKIDRATDVLSFPEREALSQEVLFQDRYQEPIHMGDLIVSMETVARAAQRARRPVKEELLEVFIHGCLHLLGLDHIGSSGRDRARARHMKALQRELFWECRRSI